MRYNPERLMRYNPESILEIAKNLRNDSAGNQQASMDLAVKMLEDYACQVDLEKKKKHAASLAPHIRTHAEAIVEFAKKLEENGGDVNAAGRHRITEPVFGPNGMIEQLRDVLGMEKEKP